MKKQVFAGLMMLAMIAPSFDAWAGAKNLDVINKSGKVVVNVLAQNNDVPSDNFATYDIGIAINGRTGPLDIDWAKTCTVNVKFVFEDGTDVVWGPVDVCGSGRFVLKPNSLDDE